MRREDVQGVRMIEPAEKLRKRAKGAYKAEQFREAAAYYQLLREHPNSPPSAADHLEHALALMRSSQPHEAEAVLKEAARLLPEEAAIRSRLGEFLLRQGRTQGALDNFRAAAQLSLTAAEPHWRLALIERSLGNEAEADAAVDTCLAIDPDHPNAREAAEARRRPASVDPEAQYSHPEIADAAFADLVEFIHSRPAEDARPAPRKTATASRPLFTALAAAVTFIVLYVSIRTALL